MNVLNHLFLIQQRETKAQRLTAAQQAHLTHKAYRGVPYAQAHTEGESWGWEIPGTYRGVQTTLHR